MPLAGTFWWPFDPDKYLDLRRPEWREHERLGHVRYDRTGPHVLVHLDFASPVISAVAGIPPFSTYAIRYKEKPFVTLRTLMRELGGARRPERG